jgi:1-deoxy-D-xylulose-5-phosphate reductoisomerase
VEAVTAGSDWRSLLSQIREFDPRVVGVADPAAASRLREAFAGSAAPEILDGPDAAREVAALPALDLVVNALVGSVGLIPTVEALESGTSVAIANKEPLVAAGELVLAAAGKGGGEILPLDSELSAIHQCLRGNSGKSIRRILLTASGGPFRSRAASEFGSITPEDALSHPTWDMGPKISVDSATLMNKGLEIIETHFYFSIAYSSIEVVVHPQSLIHSMVEFVDHSVMAQISEPDMRLPIQYALTHPERLATRVRPLDLVEAGPLTFEEPDLERFPCLRLAREAGEAGGTAPAVLNAANEVAVEAFLNRRIRFPEIPAVIEKCLERCAATPEPTLENFQLADGFTRDEAERVISSRAGRTRVRGHAS